MTDQLTLHHPEAVTDDDFAARVIEGAKHKPVLVDFWAAWCGPCRMVAPEIEKIAERYGDRVTVLKLDTETNPKMVAAFGVNSIPMIALFRPDAPPRGTVGFHTAEQLAELFGLADLPVVEDPSGLRAQEVADR